MKMTQGISTEVPLMIIWLVRSQHRVTKKAIFFLSPGAGS